MIGGALANVVRFNKGVIGVVHLARYFSAKQLADEYKGESTLPAQRHIAANLTNSHKNLTAAYPDRMIYANIRVKYYVQRRHSACRVVMTERFLVN